MVRMLDTIQELTCSMSIHDLFNIHTDSTGAYNHITMSILFLSQMIQTYIRQG